MTWVPDRILFDARNAMFRAAWANRRLSHVNDDGDEFPTGAIYGFAMQIAHVASVYGCPAEVFWEGSQNWRRRAFPGYKLRPQDLAEKRHAGGMTLREAVEAQTGPLMELLRHLAVPQWHPEDGEADDAIATRAHELESEGYYVLIVSGDGDLLQCVSESTRVHSPSRDGHTMWTPTAVTRDMGGLGPSWVPDMKGLAGDTSDKLPGCRKVGRATALELLAKYGRVCEVLEAAEIGLITGKIGQFLVEDAEVVLTCRRLAEVDRAASIIVDVGQWWEEGALEVLRAYGIKSLQQRDRFAALANLGAEVST